MSETGLNNPYQAFLDAGIELTEGARFGDDQYLRLNFASPQSLVTEALDRMSSVLSR